MKTTSIWKTHLCGWTGRLLALLAACSYQLYAQEIAQTQPAMLVKANDRFALDLLQKTHGEAPDRNIVVAPLPVSLTFAALWDGTADSESAKELRAAFHWDKDFATPIGGKMLLARFAKPNPIRSDTRLRPRRTQPFYATGSLANPKSFGFPRLFFIEAKGLCRRTLSTE